MSAAEVEHEFKITKEAPDAQVKFTWPAHTEMQRVVEVIRTAIPRAAVFFYDSVISVRATPDGASRDVVLVPGDRFTVTSTTVIRRTPAKWAFTPAPETASAEPFTIDAAHLARQRSFSDETFGPGVRESGVIDHIRKELVEVADAETLEQAVSEWVDVIILAFDGATRTGVPPQEVLDAVLAKQERNEARSWPDWRTADPNKAIEHVRNDSTEPLPSRAGFDQKFDPMQGRYLYVCGTCGDEAAYCDGTRHRAASMPMDGDS